MSSLRLVYCLLLFCLPVEMAHSLNSVAAKSGVARPLPQRTQLVKRRPGLPKKSSQETSSSMMSPTTLATYFRGGAVEGVVSKEDGSIKTAEELKEKAMKSIADCCFYALGAGILGAASFIVESNSAISRLTPLQWVQFLGQFHRAIFGVCLYRSLKLFRASTKGGVRPSALVTYKVSQILAWMWGITALIRSIHALAYSFTTGIGWFELLSAFVLTTNFPFCHLLHRHISQQQSRSQPVQEGYALARTAGLAAVRNVLCCVVPMGIMGSTELVRTGITICKSERHLSTAWSLVNGLLDSAELITIASLLALLYQNQVRSILVITHFQRPKDRSATIELFKIQAEFYSKISSVFAAELVFIALPYVFPVGSSLYGVYTTLESLWGVFFP